MNKPAVKNITLIGMPTSGKSTAGVILAKVRGMDFIDTDIVIQQREGLRLDQIIKERGVEGFLEVEEKTLLDIHPDNAVIATGGSVIYSRAAMEHLALRSTIVYLKIELAELKRRLGDIRERGVVLKPGESLEQMYAVRSELYEEYAELTISEENCSIEDTVEAIQRSLKNGFLPA